MTTEELLADVKRKVRNIVQHLGEDRDVVENKVQEIVQHLEDLEGRIMGRNDGGAVWGDQRADASRDEGGDRDRTREEADQARQGAQHQGEDWRDDETRRGDEAMAADEDHTGAQQAMRRGDPNEPNISMPHDTAQHGGPQGAQQPAGTTASPQPIDPVAASRNPPAASSTGRPPPGTPGAPAGQQPGQQAGAPMPPPQEPGKATRG